MVDEAGPWGAAQTGEITFSITTTLADHLAFHRYFRTLPTYRHWWQVAIIVAFVAAVLLAVAVCGLVQWGLDIVGRDIDEVLDADGRLWLFGKMFAAVAAAEAALGGAYILQWRASRDGRVRAKLALRPNVSADDPELREVIQVRMDEQGYACATPNWSEGYSWAISQCGEETDAHFFIMINARRGIILPKRDMHASIAASVRDLIGRKLTKEPKAAPPLASALRP